MYQIDKDPVQLRFLFETPRGIRSHRGRRVEKMDVDEYCDRKSKKKLDLLAEVAAIALEREFYAARKRGFPFTRETIDRFTANDEPCDECSCDEGTQLPDNLEELFPKECSQESTSSAVPVRSDGVELSPSTADNSIVKNTSELAGWIGVQVDAKTEKNFESSGDIDRHEENNNKSSDSTQPSTITCKTWKSQYKDTTKNTSTPTPTPTSDILSSKFWKASPALFKPQTTKQPNDRYPFRSRKIRCNRQMRGMSDDLQNPAVPEAVVTSIPLAEENGFNVNKESPITSRKWQEVVQPSRSSPCGRYSEAIRSVVVPDINIMNTETSTVGHLRSIVCNALNNMFSDGFNVSVFYRGKMMTDDSQTLREAGLSDYCDNELRIKLEPRSLKQCTADLTESLLPRIPHGCDVGAMSSSPLAMVVDPSSPRRPYPYSLLTGAQSLNQNRPSTMVPFQRRRSSSNGERRARRPFTVAEVEALVRTVEELGTGRWRDVKNRAFAHSEHRTYVDLKDKWKTLVHTAELGAQQRRGEPVPQQLLNRVMATQTFWANQQRLRNENQTIHIKDD